MEWRFKFVHGDVFSFQQFSVGPCGRAGQDNDLGGDCELCELCDEETMKIALLPKMLVGCSLTF